MLSQLLARKSRERHTEDGCHEEGDRGQRQKSHRCKCPVLPKRRHRRWQVAEEEPGSPVQDLHGRHGLRCLRDPLKGDLRLIRALGIYSNIFSLSAHFTIKVLNREGSEICKMSSFCLFFVGCECSLIQAICTSAAYLMPL